MPPKFKRYSDRGGASTARESERVSLLDGMSDDDNDFFLNGPSAKPGRQSQTDPKIQKLQGQVDEVIDVMQDNIGRVMDRGDRLDELEDKSENLSSNADLFRVRAKGLKSTMWWRQCKMRIILALVIVIILAIIFIPIIVKHTNK